MFSAIDAGNCVFECILPMQTSFHRAQQSDMDGQKLWVMSIWHNKAIFGTWCLLLLDTLTFMLMFIIDLRPQMDLQEMPPKFEMFLQNILHRQISPSLIQPNHQLSWIRVLHRH